MPKTANGLDMLKAEIMKDAPEKAHAGINAAFLVAEDALGKLGRIATAFERIAYALEKANEVEIVQAEGIAGSLGTVSLDAETIKTIVRHVLAENDNKPRRRG